MKLVVILPGVLIGNYLKIKKRSGVTSFSSDWARFYSVPRIDLAKSLLSFIWESVHSNKQTNIHYYWKTP